MGKEITQKATNIITQILKHQKKVKQLLNELEVIYPELQTREDDDYHWLLALHIDAQGVLPSSPITYLNWLRAYLELENPNIMGRK
jgi:hypothetical protein